MVEVKRTKIHFYEKIIGKIPLLRADQEIKGYTRAEMELDAAIMDANKINQQRTKIGCR